jgi:NAD-dependent SIR2 family protein deacetylase
MEHLQKKDIDLIIEVNKKAVEIEMAVADQNEELISLIEDVKKSQDLISKNIDEFNSQLNSIDKEIYKLQVLYVMGFLTLVAQIIQIFLKK